MDKVHEHILWNCNNYLLSSNLTWLWWCCFRGGLLCHILSQGWPTRMHPPTPIYQPLPLLSSTFTQQPCSTATSTKAFFKDRTMKMVQELQKYFKKLVTTRDGFKKDKSCTAPSAIPRCQNMSLVFWLNCCLTWAYSFGEINALPV